MSKTCIRHDSELSLTAVFRTDPRLNMSRFYAVGISQALFGDVALVRSWGRIGMVGRTRVDLFPSWGEAEVALAHIIAEKLKRGYRPDGARLERPARPKRKLARATAQADLFEPPSPPSVLRGKRCLPRRPQVDLHLRKRLH